jgi:glyoxylase-like metal-dependent hydrolase (beta-lactamase superfamily II)
VSEAGKPSGSGHVEAIYDAVRRALSAEADAPARGAVAPEVRVFPVRTPTLPPAAHTGCYVVGPSEGAGELLVVDPASPYPEEHAALAGWLDAEAAAGRRVVGIALTHHHGDHVGGAANLAAHLGAPIWAHAETARLVDGWIAVDRRIEGGEVLDVGGLRVEVMHTPGHAIGHLVFRVPSGAVIAGDMVAGIGTILIDPDEGDMTEYLASLARMAAWPSPRLLPAHGPAIDDGAAKLREYIAHRGMREARVAAALDDAGGPVAARALVAIAYADTPPPLWPLAERSLLAHLIKLERDGRATRTADGDWRAGG